MKLNLGAGHRILDGWVNADKFPAHPSVEREDLSVGLSYPSEHFDEVLLDNVIEHILDIPGALVEIHRVLRPGGRVTLITPHFSSGASWRDPTHVHHLSFFSFDYLEGTSRDNYIPSRLFKVVRKRLSFPGGLGGLFGRLLFQASPRAWENRYCFVWRGSTLTFVLEKL